jgi:hypothetical protein
LPKSLPDAIPQRAIHVTNRFPAFNKKMIDFFAHDSDAVAPFDAPAKRITTPGGSDYFYTRCGKKQ